MRVFKNFLPDDIQQELLDLSKTCYYRKVEDDIYNFKGYNITGELFDKIASLFKEYKLIGYPSILRIQRIDTKVSVTGNYHRHDLIYKENVVCFLNENFIGGDFEYIMEGTHRFSPKTNTAIIFDPNLRHRVHPVLEGERYTLVAFLEENLDINKKQKTLI